MLLTKTQWKDFTRDNYSPNKKICENEHTNGNSNIILSYISYKAADDESLLKSPIVFLFSSDFSFFLVQVDEEIINF